MFQRPFSRGLSSSHGEGEEDTSARRIMIVKEKSDKYRRKVDFPQRKTDITTEDMIVDMRDRSILTADTVDSGMYSSDLLHQMDPISDTDSELDKILDGEDFAAQESILVNNSNTDEIEMDLSMSKFYDDIMGIKSCRLSSWMEDKPFDEESIRQLSAKGEGNGVEAIFAGGAAIVREDILPPLPASYDDLAGLEENCNHNDRSMAGDNDSKARGFKKAQATKRCGISWKNGIVICVLTTILLVGGILVGLYLPRAMADQQTNQTVASASSDSDGVNTTADVAPSASPSGSIVKLPMEDTLDQIAPEPVSSPTAYPTTLSGSVVTPAEPVGDDGDDEDDAKQTNAPAPDEDALLPSPEPTPATVTLSPTPDPPTLSPVSSSPSASPTASVCTNMISVSQECLLLTDNAITIDFMNCDPQDGDRVIVDADGADFTNPRWVEDNPWQMNWRCGDLNCDGSLLIFRFGYPTDTSGLDALLLRAYLARQTREGGPWEIVAVSRSFTLTFPCA